MKILLLLTAVLIGCQSRVLKDDSIISAIRSFVNQENNHQPSSNGYWVKPAFCHKLDCPKYTVLHSEKNYELRQYEATHWVSTELQGVDFDAAQEEMFMKLFQYISGKNARKEKIDMTAPVKMRIIPGPGPACANNFTMSFFISDSLTSPPQLTESDVMLTQVPEQKVYVRSFGGFAKKDDWIDEAANLAGMLPRNASYHSDFYYGCGYDSPFTLLNRHNEIWFIAE